MKHSKKHRQSYGNQNHTMVLKLNKAYIAIDVCTWEEAIGKIFNGNAEIVESYDDILLHSGSSTIGGEQNVMKCPCIIRMINADVNQYDLVTTLPLTPKTLFDRDDGRCCYCGKKLTISKMTFEHVYPESKGGLSDWANLRACCNECNSEKGDKLLSELGWTLRKRVGIPTLSHGAPKNIINEIGGRIPHESWRPYIYWTVQTPEKIRDL